MASSSWKKWNDYERENWRRDLRDIDIWYDLKPPNLQSFLNLQVPFYWVFMSFLSLQQTYIRYFTK